MYAAFHLTKAKLIRYLLNAPLVAITNSVNVAKSPQDMQIGWASWNVFEIYVSHRQPNCVCLSRKWGWQDTLWERLIDTLPPGSSRTRASERPLWDTLDRHAVLLELLDF